MDKPTDHRATLAQSVLDDAILRPRTSLHDELNSWLTMIAGIGGYISCTACALDYTVDNFPPKAEHLQAMGDIIERAAKIAGCLALAIEGGAA